MSVSRAVDDLAPRARTARIGPRHVRSPSMTISESPRTAPVPSISVAPWTRSTAYLADPMPSSLIRAPSVSVLVSIPICFGLSRLDSSWFSGRRARRRTRERLTMGSTELFRIWKRCSLLQPLLEVLVDRTRLPCSGELAVVVGGAPSRSATTGGRIRPGDMRPTSRCRPLDPTFVLSQKYCQFGVAPNFSCAAPAPRESSASACCP